MRMVGFTLLLGLTVTVSTACIEDSVIGVEATPISLPRGAGMELSIGQPLPPAGTYILDVDDPGIVSVGVTTDHARLHITGHNEGFTTIHVTFRESVLHIPTTVVPAPVVPSGN